ncbi:hypothetical protein AX16_004803 [Volvariella volvacea WC 439]|nr:hypothetical protein AX16_004803 [Volvariella volvacea WC 439]
MEGTKTSLSPIERCPNEILSRIYHFIAQQNPVPRKRDARALRLTCRHLNVFFTQYSISRVEFSWSVEEIPTGLSIRERAFRQMVAPAPKVFIPFASYVTVYFFGFNRCRQELQTPQVARDLVDQLEPFWDEIRRYESLKHLEVHWSDSGAGEGPERPIYQIVADKLFRTVQQATNFKLQRLSWFVPYALRLDPLVPESFQSTLGLQELYVDGYYDSEHPRSQESTAPTISLLGDLVLRNPSLRSISLHSDSPYIICKWEDMFPAQVDQLAVEKIEVEGYFTGSPSMSPISCPTFPKVPFLKELNISNPQRLYRQFGLNLDALWIVLKNSSTRLSKLTLTYGLSDVLGEYLQSYSGLSHWDSKICLPSVTTNTNGNLSDHFLQKILPHHASSLVVLRLSPDLKREWVSNNSNWEGIAIDRSTWPISSSFTNLTTLTTTSLPSWDLTAERLQQLLDYITEMPRLSTFEIEWLHLGLPTTDIHVSTRTGGRDDADEFGQRIASIQKRVFIRRCALLFLRIWRTLDAGWGMVKYVVQWVTIFPFTTDSENGDETDSRILAYEERFPLDKFRFSTNYEDSDVECELWE